MFYLGENYKDRFVLPDPEEAAAEFSAEDLADDMEGLTPQYPRAKIVSGGANQFEVGADPENPQLERFLDGVLLYQHPSNAYWQGDNEDEGNAPVCQSFDGKIGFGDPGGACISCVNNQFGSAVKDGKPAKGKLCKNMQGTLLATKKQWCAAWQEQVQYLGRHKAREYFGARRDEDVRAEQVIEHLEGLPYRFIHALAHHFETEYAVEISEEDIQKQLYPKEPGPYHPESEKTAYHTALQETVLQYEDILRLIAQQFEGRSLQEQAVYTLKTNCCIAAHRFSGISLYSMKEHRIVFSRYSCRYANGYAFPWQLNEEMMPVMRGFHYYETGCISSQTAGSYAEPFIPFPNGKKVLGFKMYKTGRVDLVFCSQDNAYDFAREYLTRADQP